MEKKYLKKAGLIALTIGLILVSGCTGGGDSTTTSTEKTTTSNQGETSTTQPQEDIPTEIEELYSGFMEVKAGQWAEYVIKSGEMEINEKIKNLGENTINNIECTGFEIEMDSGKETSIMQIWTDSSNQKMVKYAMKTQDMVFCMDVGDFDEEMPAMGGEEGTPEEYMPEMQEISYGTYTTPTGKTVDVAKFKIEGAEAWVSSEVPFGMVKTVTPEGNTSMYLYDYGLSGAKRSISEDDILNCMDISQLMGNMSMLETPDMPELD
ncbi:MAG: hypothetical protein B6U97_01945 [Candidatus Altiarchaeales archaeon ex4484_96]|nr:MAG: hypothetical protein B6U97_01945 [Candidatus Altiarchaeales archaeon ex4484_96]